MSSRQIITYVLSALVLAVTVLALLGIWDLIQWEYVQRYFWKSLQSLVIILISSAVIYLIQSIFRSNNENPRPQQRQSDRE